MFFWKELLLFEIILEEHEIIEQKVYQDINEMKQDRDIAEQLAKKLPPEVLKEHLEHDSSAVEKVFSVLPVKEGTDKDTFSAAFHAIYFATLHEAEIGENILNLTCLPFM